MPTKTISKVKPRRVKFWRIPLAIIRAVILQFCKRGKLCASVDTFGTAEYAEVALWSGENLGVGTAELSTP